MAQLLTLLIVFWKYFVVAFQKTFFIRDMKLLN